PVCVALRLENLLVLYRRFDAWTCGITGPKRSLYFCRKTILPRVRSYGESSTFTRSPGRMRMKCLRIFPDTTPRISRSELSSLSLNIALGNACDTVASISIGSDLATDTLPSHRSTFRSPQNMREISRTV